MVIKRFVTDDMRMKDDSIQKLASLVSQKTGLRVADRDGGAVRKAAAERAREKKLTSPEDYLRLLESDTAESAIELDHLISPLMVGESYFFRDKGQFQLVRDKILPELAERRKNDKTLNIWSAGCARGEEAYSIAITISETFPDLADWKIRILGTDAKEEFLEKARGGVYGAWSFRAVPDGVIKKYFYERDDRFELDLRIREMVVFLRGDLGEDDYPAPFGDLRDMDLILCRNVFIYYKSEAVAKMVKKLAETLRDGGYLITGHGEIFSPPTKILKPRLFPESLAYRRVKEGADEPLPVFKTTYQPPVLVEKRLSLPAPIFSPPASPSAKEDLESLYSTAEKYFLGGDYGKAINKLNSVLEEDPRHLNGLCLMANALANIGEHAKAGENLKLAVKADPLSPKPYYLLARIAEEKGDGAAAIECLGKIIYLEPSSVSAYLELAAIYENTDEIEKAKKVRKSALSVLKTMSKERLVEPYGETADKMISTVERLLV